MPLPWIDMGPDPAPGTAPTWLRSLEPVAPVALWTLDDMDATCRDWSGNGLHGTYEGSLSHGAAGPLGAPATICTEFGASGVTNYGRVVVPAYGPLDLRGAWTIGIWLYATAYRNVPESSTAIMCHQWGPIPYYFTYGTQGGGGMNQRICLSQHTGTAITNCPDTIDLPLNTWKHYVGTNDGAGTLRLYRDGVHVNSAGAWNGIGPGPAFFIGSDAYFTSPSINYFPGRLWRARVYNVALSAAQILGVYQRELAIAPWMPLGVVT